MSTVMITEADLQRLDNLLEGRNKVAIWTFLNEQKLTPLSEVGEQKLATTRVVEDVHPNMHFMLLIASLSNP